MKQLLSIFALCCSITCLHAQYYTNQNKQWVFGLNAGLDFTSGTPVPFTSSISAGEGCASVADADGHLLFYSEGTTVYNRLGAVMPSGSGIVPFGTGTTTQGAVIVPVPGQPSKYYLFSLGYFAGSDPNCYLAYSIVDMTLNGGLGDLQPGSIGVPLFDSLSEKMTAVKGEQCNIWLITHRKDINEFLAFRITPGGISAPVVSHSGTISSPMAYIAGALKVSHDRRQLVTQNMTLGLPGRTELHDFDTVSGLVSNCRVLDSLNSQYGVEFSPDNSKLYTQSSNLSLSTSEICQFDLSLPDLSAIQASRTVLCTYSGVLRRDIRLAPDGKIYLNNCSSHYLDRIDVPNAAGTGCGYVVNAIDIGNTNYSSLSATVIEPVYSAATAVNDLIVCYPEHSEIAAPTGASYLWYDGTKEPTHPVVGSGKYWVEVYFGCERVTDTFNVIVDTLYPIHLGNDTTLASGHTLMLTAPHASGSIHWSTGSSADTIYVSTPGIYWATVTDDNCTVSDTIKVSRPAGIEDHVGSPALSVFPNPAGNNVTIEVAGIEGDAVFISLYDNTGMCLARQSEAVSGGLLHHTLPLSSYPDGIYHLRISDHSGRYLFQKTITKMQPGE